MVYQGEFFTLILDYLSVLVFTLDSGFHAELWSIAC
jgi:hypothetical protein